jgi:predicted dehydrogenase
VTRDAVADRVGEVAMATERSRVGVVGTGWWTELTHLPGLQARGDVEVVALAGRNQARLAALADRFGVPGRHADWRELLARERLDALVIVTPTILHHPIALAALSAGVHVICEKPLAMDRGQALELAALARARRRSTLTFFTHRALPAAVRVKQLVEAGFLGRPLQVLATYLTGSQLKPGKGASWRMRRAEAGTGVLGDIGSHLVDLVRWWLGDFDRVSGQWMNAHPDRAGGSVDGDEACSFLARLDGGVQAVFLASKLAAGHGNSQRIELCGEAGTLVYQADPGVEPGWTGQVLAGRPDRVGLVPLELPEGLTAGFDGPEDQAGRAAAYRRLTDPFFASLASGGPCHPDFDDGAAVQAVLDAVATSAERGGWVSLR